ncbi:MAG: isoprenylcysteine carboxylmethyltransferase family protein [Candidatus Nanopelagicales bacterium]
MQFDATHHRTGSRLVLAQFALIGVCVAPLGPTLWSGLWALGLVALLLAAAVGALALRSMGADTRVHPVPDAGTALHTHGLYAWIRHPMYLAVLLACLGVTLASGRALALVGLLSLMGVLAVKSRFEDRLLAAKFGAQFSDYAARVPALVPRPWRTHRR